MDSLKYYVAISAACAFTLTPCSAKEAIGDAMLARPAPANAVGPAAATATPEWPPSGPSSAPESVPR